MKTSLLLTPSFFQKPEAQDFRWQADEEVIGRLVTIQINSFVVLINDLSVRPIVWMELLVSGHINHISGMCLTSASAHFYQRTYRAYGLCVQGLVRYTVTDISSKSATPQQFSSARQEQSRFVVCKSKRICKQLGDGYLSKYRIICLSRPCDVVSI